jgi:hypothetical protein
MGDLNPRPPKYETRMLIDRSRRSRLWMMISKAISVVLVLKKMHQRFWSQVSSVSVVSDYGLDDRVSIPGRHKGFFL